jgi:hypothetical protein
MKSKSQTIIKSIFILSLTVLTLSCYLETNNTNSIALSISSHPSLNYTVKAPEDELDTIRIYIYHQDNLYSTPEGKPFIEESITAGNAITITDLPANLPTKIVAAVGITGDYFVPAYYAESDIFTISTGTATNVSLTLVESPLSYSAVVGGKSISGFKKVNGTLFAAEEDGTLYTGTTMELLAKTNASLPENIRVNSISIGKFFDGSGVITEPWCNTTAGIYPIRSNQYNTTFGSGLSAISVIQSGAFNLGDFGIDSAISVFFQTNGGLGGTYITESNYQNPESWLWTDNIDLTAYLTGKPILDFTVSGSNAYFATKLGSFRISSSIVNGSLNIMSIEDIFDLADFFKVTGSDGEDLQITSMEIEGNIIYLGTEDGIWKGNLTDNETVVENLQLIDGTLGKKIAKIQTASTQSKCVFLSMNDIYILQYDTGVVQKLPEAILPGQVHDFQVTSDETLFIAGTNGLSSMSLE